MKLTIKELKKISKATSAEALSMWSCNDINVLLTLVAELYLTQKFLERHALYSYFKEFAIENNTSINLFITKEIESHIKKQTKTKKDKK